MLCLLAGARALGAPAGNLDQAQNGGVASPPISPVDWINGNSNAQKSHYVEGESIPYRLVLTDLAIGSHVVDIEWDIRKSSKATIDYVTSFQRINETVDPIKGLVGTFGTPATFPIPPPPVSTTTGTPGGQPQPLTSFSNLPAAEKLFTIYNGTITSLQYVEPGSWSVADSSQRLRITFQATSARVVLAWGGHITSRRDWGDGNSANAVPGSPYHTRFIGLDGKGGNQDVALAAAAVCLPPNCAISGPTSVCPATPYTYTAQTDGTGNTFLWTLTGNGTLVGPTTGPSVQVTPGSSGTYTLTVTISRPATSGGCSSTCSQTATVRALPPCTITRLNAPGAQTAGATLYQGPAGMAHYAWTVSYNGDPAVSAGEDLPSVTLADPVSQGGGLATITVGLTVVDEFGCTSTCARVFEAPGQCIVPPPAGCPRSLETFAYGGDPTGNTFLWSIATPGSPVTIVGANNLPNLTVTSPVCAEFLVRLEVTAPDGFVTICEAPGAFVDTVRPVLGNLPTGGDLGCNPTPPSCSRTVTALDDCDGDISGRVVCVAGPIVGNGSCRRSQTFTYSVADTCGNATTAEVVYTWTQDTTAPVLGNLPTARDLGCNPTRPSCSTTVTALDDCDGDLSARVVCTAGPILENGPCARSQVFTYRVVDTCGNAAEASVTLTWREDTTPPVLGNLPVGGELGCNPILPVCATTVTARDLCDGDVSASVTCTPGPIVTDGCLRRQTFTYAAVDSCGNSTSAQVVYTWRQDVTPPVLRNLPSGGDLGCNPTRPTCSQEVLALDACDGDVSRTLVCTPGPIEATARCTYSQAFTYEARDTCGNTVAAVVVYRWTEDTTAPELLNLPPGGDLGCNPVRPTCVDTVVARDLCDGDISGRVRCIAGPILDGALCAKTQVFTYSVTDRCGNTAEARVTYTWTEDRTPPVIVCPAVQSPIECPAIPEFPEATVSDACDPSPRMTYVDRTSPGPCPQSYRVTRTWTAVDACGNAASCSATIEVRDTVPPIAAWPGDVNLACTDCDIDPAKTGTPTASDLCGPVTITYDDTITGTCPKRVERRWTVSDGCNEIRHVQVIQCLPTTRVVVTDSSLCTYDLDPTTACREFRLLFTQDTQNFPQYRLNASNPGQTYFNLFYNGRPGTTVTLNLTIPYPYVTQGAQPIHAYDGVSVVPGPNGQECYLPGNGFLVDSTQIVLSDYAPQRLGSSRTVSVTLTVPSTGFVYLNMHLDYGLKRSTGYARGGPSGNDAIDPTTLQPLIPDRASYLFAFSDGMESASDSVCSMNAFKKVPGVGGMVAKATTTYDGLPTTQVLQGCKVVLRNIKGETLASGRSDEDGWFFCTYKWTGKATTLYLTLSPVGEAPQTKPVTLKANGYAQVDFEVP
jgi:hypothetical protein